MLRMGSEFQYITTSVVDPYPDPHQRDKLDQDPALHQSEKLDPDPHQFANDKQKCMENETIGVPVLFQGFEPLFRSGFGSGCALK